MARRGYDDFGREMMCDRRGRDPREMRREQYPRDYLDGREHCRIDRQDPDRMDYTRDSHPGSQTTTRDSTSRPVYFYAGQMGRDDRFSRGHMDDSRERQRPSIDLQSERREVSSPCQDYFLPGEDINREVIQFDISRHLGDDALVRPYVHLDGRRGFLITAYRAPTSAMIATLKQDSKRYENEAAQRRRQFGQSAIPYGSSATYDDRERMSRPDVPQPGYAGCSMDTTIDDYDEERPTPRGYREQESRMVARMDTRHDPRLDTRHDPRLDTRHDPRQDPRQQPATNRPTQMPSAHQAYSQDPAYPSSSQVQLVSSGPYGEATQPRTLGPNNTPPPPTGGGGQPICPIGYPSEQELKTALNHLESLQCPGRPIPHVEKAQVKNSDVMKIVAAAVGGGAIGAVGVRAYDVAILRAALRGR